MARRTRGISLPQLIEELTPYLIGRRGYFGFCQTWLYRRFVLVGCSGAIVVVAALWFFERALDFKFLPI
jgi:hypothetical protein